MPFLAYIAIILVSLGGILFELNWLTSPKLETKPAVQASTTSAPPKVAVATVAPREAEIPNNESSSGPRNAAPNVTMVPGGTAAPKPAEAAPSQSEPSVAPTTTPPQQTASAPPITPAPAFSAAETTGTSSTDFKREFSTDAKADSSTSSATFTPAIITPAAAATPAVAASSNNKCDIAACSASYQSFRASDCTYQPMDGATRKVCDRTSGGAQQAAAPREQKAVTAVRNDTGRTQASKETGLRAFEREVRRITASEANLDPGYDRGRSQVIVIERRDW